MKTKLVAPPTDMLEKLWVMILLTVVSAGLYPLVYYARLHSKLTRLSGQIPFNWKLLLSLVVCAGLSTSLAGLIASYALTPYSSQQEMLDKVNSISVLNLMVSAVQLVSVACYIFIAVQTRHALVSYSEKFHERFDISQPSLVWCLIFNLFYINHYLVKVRRQIAKRKSEQSSLKNIA